MLQDSLLGRKKLLEEMTGQPVRTPMCVLKMEKKAIKSKYDHNLENRVAERYFKEINNINKNVGEPEIDRDELFPDGPPAKVSKPNLNLLESEYWKSFEVAKGQRHNYSAGNSVLKEKKKNENNAKVPKGKSLLQKKPKASTPSQMTPPKTDVVSTPSTNHINTVPTERKTMNVVEAAVANIPGLSPIKGI